MSKFQTVLYLEVGLVIAKLLGHATTWATERYVHARDESLRAAVSLLESRFPRRLKFDTPAYLDMPKEFPSPSKFDN